ncbi:Outward-rectifier potassium channel TOK1 [Cytospora mali]|uniref:Outward-rectifier potassium channel TOK1 n=1 Tax=Cytospora mali TaxID=578113 RepID=A0A194UVH3_CYTMA|nr:Outward-rectifier potassium channel TOK1 [Valsa mali var. pyri (nom. inval.)]
MMADSGDRVEEHVETLDCHDAQMPEEKKQSHGHSNDHSHEESQDLDKEQSPGGDPIHNDEAHLDPSRWWFASSAFPMIVGTLGPVASAFSICALVRPWREKFPPGSDIDKAPFIADPIWLTVINAVQLGVAVVANLVLLLNMARKIRFSVAQPVTIVAWYFSSICLMALSATAAGPLHKEPESMYIWSQAFYYGIYAASLYFFCSSLMVVTFWGALKGHYSRDFQLTTSQRTLMLQTIMFLIYLLLGALVFSTIEGWDYLDAVYWADATLFTVGFGDFAASTAAGRALLFPYALIGVISLGLVIGSIRSLVLERARRQLGARMLEKERKRVLKRRLRSGKDDILNPVTEDDEGDKETPGQSEYERRRREFELMRKIQIKAEHRRRWMAMGISTTVWLILWLVGAAIFQQCEVSYQGWTYFDGFYFAFVSLTTIGYGDVTPISPAGKSFFVFWSLLALPTMTVLISNAGDTVVKAVRDVTDQLGTVTILPDERGIRKGLKEMARSMFMGHIFGEDSDIEESPPGGLGFSEEHKATEAEDEDEKELAQSRQALERSNEKLGRDAQDVSTTSQTGRTDGSRSGEPMKKDDAPTNQNTPSSTTIHRPESSSTTISFKDPPEMASSKKKRAFTMNSSNKKGRGDWNQKNIESKTLKMSRATSVPRSPSELPREVPTDPHEYRFTLIDEIVRVTKHLKSQPPRKYSFAEWAWYLKLIGEDEHSAERHQKPVVKDRKKGHAGGGEDEHTEEDQDNLQWSWVGSRSPLMGSQEEAEWILGKLEKKLMNELMRARDEAKKAG